MNDKDFFMARRVAEAVDAAGGRTFYVGGFVRDRLLHQPNTDIDIEVHGVSPEVLEGILDSLGGCTKKGISFGIYGLAGCTLDIAMPRREEATGRGHRDFQVYVDPYLGTEKAARRRDFTMNAMMEDVMTGQIVDHFGGWHDLREGVLRHVDDETWRRSSEGSQGGPVCSTVRSENSSGNPGNLPKYGFNCTGTGTCYGRTGKGTAAGRQAVSVLRSAA